MIMYQKMKLLIKNVWKMSTKKNEQSNSRRKRFFKEK